MSLIKEASTIDVDTDKVNQTLELLTNHQQELDTIKAKLESTKRSNYCSTESDAHIMRTANKHIVLGYNV